MSSGIMRYQELKYRSFDKTKIAVLVASSHCNFIKEFQTCHWQGTLESSDHSVNGRFDVRKVDHCRCDGFRLCMELDSGLGNDAKCTFASYHYVGQIVAGRGFQGSFILAASKKDASVGKHHLEI